MKEDFLHYVWKFQKFPYRDLTTSQGDALQVIHVGIHNQHDGPDFKEAQLIVGDLKWIGSVELHLKSSDWYRHNHHQDQNYDTVILHVVWEDDIEVCREDGSVLPTLVLKNLVAKELLYYYQETFLKSSTFIPCESQLAHFPQPLFQFWKERLFVARLEEKSKRIQALLKAHKNDWEAVLFCLLARNFGLNVNGASFFALAYTFVEGGHIRITLFLEKLSGLKKKIIEIWCLAVASFFSGYLAFYFIKMLIISYKFQERSEGADEILIWIPQTSVAIGSVIFFISVFHQLILIFRNN